MSSQKSRVPTVAFFSALLFATSVLALGQTFTTLYNFDRGKGGENPAAGLILDGQGNLYGTASAGGVGGQGTIFSLTPDGVETALFHFGPKGIGADPQAGLIRDRNGNLFGTTFRGFHNKGTVFELTSQGTFKALYTFSGKGDGGNPWASLTHDGHGNLYGTTFYGGNLNRHICQSHPPRCGVVFELTPDGTETVLYTFTGGTDGAFPNSGLIRNAAGNLYGTTLEGGAYNNGTVFELTKAGTLNVLHSFTGGADGGAPSGDLIRDQQGNLYGATYAGGAACHIRLGCGVLFELTPSGSETVLYTFTGGTDGAEPNGGLIRDAQGNFYGTARFGGINDAGTVFELDSSGILTVLHIFDGTDGVTPNKSLTVDPLGNLYGTTSGGGAYSLGTVFKLTP